MIWVGLLSLGLVAGIVGGVVGFGGSTILLPALVLAFGPKEAVPIMGVAGLLANLARVLVWWREVDWRAAAVYAATGVPAVALGARGFLLLDPRIVEGLLGLFLIAIVPVRRWYFARDLVIGLPGLAVSGAAIGFLTGMVASTGPLSTPVFLGHGLTKGAFIATEALGSLAIYLTKSAVFQHYGALPSQVVMTGALIGAAMMVGTWLARNILMRVDAQQYRGFMDVLMIVAGLAMIAGSALA